MITFEIPSLPPSTNHAYTNLRHGGRRLSSEGKRYKLETTSWLLRQYPTDLRYFIKDAPYMVSFAFMFQERASLLCSGWPGKAENRYKALDATNRAKLVEDVLSEVTGVNDTQNFVVVLSKCYGDRDSTTIRAWNLQLEPPQPDELKLILPAGGIV